MSVDPKIYSTARTCIPGTRVPTGSGYRIACSSSGFVRLILSDGTFYEVFCTVGQGGEDGIAVSGVAATTQNTPAATAIVTVLD